MKVVARKTVRKINVEMVLYMGVNKCASCTLNCQSLDCIIFEKEGVCVTTKTSLEKKMILFLHSSNDCENFFGEKDDENQY